MARKYYHADGKTVVKDNWGVDGPGKKLICICEDEEMAVKTALKLNAADDYESALKILAEHGSDKGGRVGLATIALDQVNKQAREAWEIFHFNQAQKRAQRSENASDS